MMGTQGLLGNDALHTVVSKGRHQGLLPSGPYSVIANNIKPCVCAEEKEIEGEGGREREREK
jgi:hypothetical protein